MKQVGYLILALCLLFSFSAQAQSVIGTWKTIDDNTGEARSHVKIYEEGGKVYGQIIKLLDPDSEGNVCEECKDHRKDKPILGMKIIDNLAKKGEAYSGGKILDPENGELYRCKIWLDDANTLKVRGYLYMFYRTQTWYRVE